MSTWPISINDILNRTSSIPSYYDTKILKEKYRVEERGGVVVKINIPVAAKYIFLFRREKRPLHTTEIVKLFYEYFGERVSARQAGSVLGRLEEALIVDVGTYDIYENLRFLETHIFISL